MLKDRKLNDIRFEFDNKILIEKFGIKRPAYHGGKFIGTHCRIIMERREEFCSIVKSFYFECVGNNPSKHQEIIKFVDRIEPYLGQLSNIFSRLRKNHGTLIGQDFEMMEGSVKQMLKLADELDLNYIPSMHILHKHAIPLCKMHNGFGELLEDLVEHSHQTMN
jgi:hypothetical protein